MVLGVNGLQNWACVVGINNKVNSFCRSARVQSLLEKPGPCSVCWCSVCRQGGKVCAGVVGVHVSATTSHTESCRSTPTSTSSPTLLTSCSDSRVTLKPTREQMRLHKSGFLEAVWLLWKQWENSQSTKALFTTSALWGQVFWVRAHPWTSLCPLKCPMNTRWNERVLSSIVSSMMLLIL